MEFTSNEAVRESVRAGLGIGFLSLHTLGLELRLGLLLRVDVEGTPVMRTWHVVQLQSKLLSPAAEAFRRAVGNAHPARLEPIMAVEVSCDEDALGSVIGDLNSRRGQIQGQDMRGNANVINAMVPLMNMFGYVNNLRSMSQGRATFTMQFDHYAEAPANVSAEVQKKFA